MPTYQHPIFTFENAKTTKGELLGYVTAIRYLAPSDEASSPVRFKNLNTCPNAGACRSVCLYTAGRGVFATTQAARIAKTRHRALHREDHLAQMFDEILRANVRARKHGLKLAVRVNGTSDLPGDALELAREFPSIQFYDYTKLAGTLRRHDLPSNYHLTLSHDPETLRPSEWLPLVNEGQANVAVVFSTSRSGDLPSTFLGVPVLDGDLHDLRFLDAPGRVVGLRAKGPARKRDEHGALPSFVVEVTS
jgi:hypothetical protein